MTQHLIVADLIKRWVYSRRGIEKLRKRDPDFPKPFATYPSGRGNRWHEEDIAAYEQLRPELLSDTLKKRKVARFAHCILKGRAGG